VLLSSPLATRASAAGLACALILLCRERISDALLKPRKVTDDVPQVGLDLLQQVVGLVALSAALTAVLVVAITMVQTRGAAGAAVLTHSDKASKRRLSPVLVPQVCIAGVISFLGLGDLSPDILYGLRIESGEQVGTHFYPLLGKICKLVVVVAVVLAILAMFVYRGAVLLRYRDKAKHN
jgi:hypothetical protein